MIQRFDIMSIRLNLPDSGGPGSCETGCFRGSAQAEYKCQYYPLPSNVSLYIKYFLVLRRVLFILKSNHVHRLSVYMSMNSNYSLLIYFILLFEYLAMHYTMNITSAPKIKVMFFSLLLRQGEWHIASI